MKVAESLAPRSRTLTSLKRHLAARGLSGISYESLIVGDGLLRRR